MEIYIATQTLINRETGELIDCGDIIVFESDERKKAALENGFVRRANVVTIAATQAKIEKSDDGSRKDKCDNGKSVDQLENMSVAQLKALAAGKGISIPAGAKKADIIAALR